MHASASLFDDLQRRFIERLGGRAPADLETGTMVVVSSISFPPEELHKITAIEHYEERMLCMLLFLKSPTLRLIFVSSMPVGEEVVDYYLSFLPDPGDARARLDLIAVDDAAPSPLTEKLLLRSDLLEQMRALLRGTDRAFILPFNVTPLEQRLAEALAIPLWGPHPALFSLGSKSSSRRIARAARVPVLPGAEDLYSLDDVKLALEELSPATRSAVIKLNNGFSGQGNAIVDLASIESPLDRSPTIFCAEDEGWSSFSRKIAVEGAVVEELVRHPKAASPSVQLRIAPGGAYEVVSTHDQILGGPDGQVYLGCRFPAKRTYRTLITQQARRIAQTLGNEGVIGSFAVDFVVVPDGDSWVSYLTEINLRMGGTTHPFLTARHVTEAHYDEESGELLIDGKTVNYVASDNLKSSRYVGMSPQVVIDGLRRAGLAYDHLERAGATLHLLSALARYGKLGTVCIHHSREQAEELYRRVEETLDDLAAVDRGAS